MLVIMNILLLGACIFLLYFPKHKDLLQVERIDVQDKSGHNRIVISNQDQIPPPLLNGVSYQRQVNPAGLIFYDANGNERGGIALSKKDKMQINALAFDYSNADAIGLLAIDEAESNYYKAGLTINQKVPSGKVGQNINRINLSAENGQASLEMKDAQEIPRLVLLVDSLGQPSIQLYDAEGKLAKHISLD